MLRGSLITFLFQVVALFLGVARGAILAALLKSEGFGMFEIFRFIPTFLHASSNLGLNNAIVNFTGRKRYTPSELTGLSISGGLLICAITITGAALIFSGVRIAFLGKDFTKLPNTAVILAVITYIPYMLWFLNMSIHLGRNRMVAYNVIWIMQPLVSFLGYLGIWIFLRDTTDISAMAGWAYVSFSGGVIVSLIVGVVILAKDGVLRWSYPGGALKESAKFGIQTHIGSFVGFLGLRINIPLLTYLMGEASVGIFGITLLVGESFKRVFSSISTALLPIASAAEGEEARTLINVVMRNTIFVCVLVLGVFALVCKPIIFLLFDEVEFGGAYLPTLVILIWVLFTSLNKVFQSDAIGRGRPIWVTYSMVATFAVLFVASWILVPVHGVMGAAWASTMSSVAGFLLWMIIYVARAEGFSLAHAIIIKPKDISKIYNKLFRSGGES